MNNFFQAFLGAAVALLLVGCAGMPGHVATTTAMLDGERRVQVEPGWLYGGGLRTPAKAGGYWTEKAPERFHLEFQVPGETAPIVGLKMSVDGGVEQFAPDGIRPGVFEVPLELVSRMVAAKRAILQIQLPGQFVEVDFSFEQLHYARPAFRQALVKIQEAKRVAVR